MQSQYPHLSLQEKLALAMTTAGSQRGLASFMGISHQKLGRWLREGEEKGIKKIPDSATELIDSVFAAHSELSQAQSFLDDLPFDAEAPVFAHRKPLRNGMPGDRVFIEHTQYIKKELRDAVLLFLIDSKRYYTLSIRSITELATYMARADERMGRRVKDRTVYEAIAKAQLLRALEEGVEYRAVFTKFEKINFGVDPYTALQNVNRKLKQRHEPATGSKGTALADQYLLQLIPPKLYDVARSQTPESRARRTRAKTRGRGNK